MKEKINYESSSVQERLLQLIQMRGLNKSKLARIAEVTPQAVTKWFNRGEISKPAAMKIAAETGVSVDWLLDGGPELFELNANRGKRLAEWFVDKELPEQEKDFFKQLIAGETPFTDKAARRIETDYGMPINHLDSGFESSAATKLSDEDKELLYYFHNVTHDARLEILAIAKEKAEFYGRVFEEMKKLKGL